MVLPAHNATIQNHHVFIVGLAVVDKRAFEIQKNHQNSEKSGHFKILNQYLSIDLVMYLL